MLIAFLLDLLTVVLAAVGTALHFAGSGWAMLRYDVVCGNLFLLLACAVQLRYEAAILLQKRLFVPSWVRLLKYCAVCAVTTVFFTALFVLAPADGGQLFRGGLLCLHLLCPLLGLASLMLADRPSLPDRRVTLWALLPTAACGAVVTALDHAGILRGQCFFLRGAAWYAASLGAAWLCAWLVWRLALCTSEPRDAGDAAEPEACAWTADGYIKNQDGLADYTYRTIPANHNSCGPVAAFDLRRFAGQEPALVEVLSELETLHLLHVPGPTFQYAMRRYLTKHLPGWREVHGRETALAAASGSRMGLFRYLEERVPHYVAYVRADGGFRFFNVSDTLEDEVLPMARFGAEHLRGGPVRLIWWE